MTFSLILIDYTADRLFYLRKVCIVIVNANVNFTLNLNDNAIVNGEPQKGSAIWNPTFSQIFYKICIRDFSQIFSNFLYLRNYIFDNFQLSGTPIAKDLLCLASSLK